MKKLLFSGLALASLTFSIAACSDKKGAAETTGASPASDSTATPANAAPGAVATTYTCSMHPEVVSDKPGKCPKCGMDLVKK